jgi:hypothetical protein
MPGLTAYPSSPDPWRCEIIKKKTLNFKPEALNLGLKSTEDSDIHIPFLDPRPTSE